MTRPDVSVVIVNWNTRDVLRNCLASVYEQTKGVTLELIVVDNASTDGSQEMVTREFPHVRLVPNKENRGFAVANNQGIELADGRYVLLLNSDTIVLDCAIQKTFMFAEQHPEAAVVGCRVLNADQTVQPTCFMFPSLLNLFLSATYLYKLFPRNRFFGRERMTWWSRDDVRNVDVVTGCFMLVRREAIQEVGAMDERFFMYAEETDWCYRFKQAGWKNLFYPEAQIIHLGGQSSARARLEMLVQLRLSVMTFCKKHYGVICAGACTFLIGLFLLVRIPYWAMLVVVPGRHRYRATAHVKAYVQAVRCLLKGTSRFKKGVC